MRSSAIATAGVFARATASTCTRRRRVVICRGTTTWPDSTRNGPTRPPGQISVTVRGGDAVAPAAPPAGFAPAADAAALWPIAATAAGAGLKLSARSENGRFALTWIHGFAVAVNGATHAVRASPSNADDARHPGRFW